MNREDLVKKLEAADKAYYDQDDEIIPDHEYDQLVKDYLELTGEKWVQFGDSGSIKHKRPMLSLEKARTLQEVTDFLGPNRDIILMPKIDGGSLSLWYDKTGQLTKAITRGKQVSGVSYGEDVTNQARLVKYVPNKIKATGFPVEVRGEVYMPVDNLELANKDRTLRNKPVFKNCRNAATGILRKESDKHFTKYLKFVAYQAFDQSKDQHDDLWFSTFVEQLNWLNNNGFDRVTITDLDKDDLPINSDTLTVEEMETFISDLPPDGYSTDGVVIMINDMAVQRSMGLSTRFPRFGLAFKFKTETAQTTIRQIQWTATRTGMVKPKAIFDPVELDGTTVEQCTLHNAKHVIDNGYSVGDIVEAYKANMIIPQLGSRIVNSGSSVDLPADCPSCQTTLKWSESNTDLVCDNLACKPKIVDLLVYSCGKKNWDIDLGESVAEALVDTGLINGLYDLMALPTMTVADYVQPNGSIQRHYFKPETWLSQLKLGEKKISFGNSRAKKLLTEIQAAKTKPWNVTLHALGCPGLGEPECREIAARYSLDDLLVMYDDQDEFLKAMTSIKGMGKTTAKSLEKFLWDNCDWLKRLSYLGLDTAKQTVVESDGNLKGLTFCITGTHAVPRSILEKLITDNGGTLTSSVSKKLSYLVAGEDAGSKLEKATKANVKIVDEEGLRCLIKGTS